MSVCLDLCYVNVMTKRAGIRKTVGLLMSLHVGLAVSGCAQAWAERLQVMLSSIVPLLKTKLLGCFSRVLQDLELH